MRIRDQLTYANVTATVALFLAVGTGGAFAISEIGSRDIKDDSVRSKDLRDGRGVKAKDVRRNTLGGQQVNENALIGSDVVAMSGSQDGTCDITDAQYVDCAAVELELERRSSLLVVATGGFAGLAATASNANCEVRIDNGIEAQGEVPGELTNNTGALATDGFARTAVFDPVPAGNHTVALACTQLGTEAAEINAPTIAVIAVTTRG